MDLDSFGTAAINGWAGQSTALDAVFVAISQYGVPLMVGAVAVQWFSRKPRTHVRHAAFSAGFAFLLGLGLNQMVLLFVHRMRPYDAGVSHLLVEKSADWSFPSDHATASISIAAILLAKGLTLRGLLLAAMAGLICLSRVYLGLHYVGDIAGGALTGLAAVAIVLLVYREGNRLDRFATSIL